LVALLLLLAAVPINRAADADSAAGDEQTLKDAGIPLDDAALLDFFRKRTLADAERAKILGLIAKLCDESYAAREQASADLAASGPAAAPLLRRALRDADVEVARRAERLLRQTEPVPGNVTAAAAARTLARRKPAVLAGVLLPFLPFADDEDVVEQLRDALAAVAVRDGQPDRALLEALHDGLPLRRGVAAEALLRAGPSEAARKLLDDPEPTVRLRVALTLAERKERDAFPVLIALLGDLPAGQVWRAEDLLCRLAGDQAPEANGTDTEARQRYRDAWLAWWRREGQKTDLARLDNPPPLGYTLAVFMDNNFGNGQVAEFNKEGGERWKLQGLQFPVDAQVLPGERVLIAEANGMRVTERNTKGEVLWEKRVQTQPVSCQRLANGNTFIACRNQLLEVDRNGKEVYTYNRPNFDILGAQKLRNGQYGFVTGTGAFVRVDAAGKEQKSFPVGQGLTFSGIDVLPSGRLLVPLYSFNKVVEYDSEGKSVWEAGVPNPTSAVRLPSGNTLVASMTGGSIIELDPQGKKVNEQKVDGRPWRASRR
jgi:HEAT repeat protein